MQAQLFILAIILSFSINTVAQSTIKQPTTPATSQPTEKVKKFPIMTFDTKYIDLGDVKRGEIKKFEFTFVNTGTAPLKIDLVSSCDCTKTQYPPMEVEPGEPGEIMVTFDSTEKEESETIDIDIFLRNEDPVTGAPMIEMLQYTYNLLD